MDYVEINMALVRCLARRAAIAAELRALRRATRPLPAGRASFFAVAGRGASSPACRRRRAKAAVQKLFGFAQDPLQPPW